MATLYRSENTKINWESIILFVAFVTMFRLKRDLKRMRRDQDKRDKQ